MIDIDTVLIKVASRCNINCSYCYVYNMGDTGWATMPARMSHETISAVAKGLGELAGLQQRRFAVVLHGGEPLLLGHTKLAHLLKLLRSVLSVGYPISIQTNGILITDEFLDVCAEYSTSVSVSIDGPRHIHNRNRVGHRNEGTYERVLAGIERLRNHSQADFLFAGLLAVIDHESDPREVYQFFKELDPPSVDFLYPDGNHSRLPPGKASFHSTEYGRWLTTLLEVYLADVAPVRIAILDRLIKILLGGAGEKEGCGITDFGIIIIDTDGSVAKNDTLKSTFNGADRFSQPWSVHTHPLTEVIRSREFASYHALQRPTASACLTCPELGICGGGMPVNRWRDENGYDNPSVYCADQLLLIGHLHTKLAALLKGT